MCFVIKSRQPEITSSHPMKTKQKLWIGGFSLATAIVLGAIWCFGPEIMEIPYEVTVVDYQTPATPPKDFLDDDRLEDKHTVFDPKLADRREYKERLVNLSDAVIRLNVPPIKPDAEKELLILQPSYSAAVEAARTRVKPIHSSEDWEPLKKFYLGEKTYLIPVDEFAEVELKGMRVLDRSELRSICDANKTKEAIVSALKQ